MINQRATIMKGAEPMNRRSIIVVTSVLLAFAAVGGVALAGGHFGPGHHEEGWVSHVDRALTVVRATPAQREAIYAARDQVVDAVKQMHDGTHGDMDKLLDLFTAEQVDRAKLQAMRGDLLKGMGQVADAALQALSDAHDVLTAPQRNKLVAQFRQHKPAAGREQKRADHRAAHPERGMAAHIDQMLS